METRTQKSDTVLPVFWLTARVSNRENLDEIIGSLAIDESERKFSQQETSSVARRGRPALWSFSDLRYGAIYFGAKSKSGIGTALEIPVESGVVFGRRCLVEFDGAIGHEAVSLDCAAGLLPKESSLPCQNPDRRSSFQFQHARQPEHLRRPCHRDWK